MSAPEAQFSDYVKQLKTQLLLGGSRDMVNAIVTLAVALVEARARIANLEANAVILPPKESP